MKRESVRIQMEVLNGCAPIFMSLSRTPDLLTRWTLVFERFDDASLGHSKADCKVLNMLNFPPGLNISAIRIMCQLPSEPLC